MDFTLVIVLVALALMIVILFFLLKKEVSDINKKSKVYFIHKAQEYTDSINRKEENIGDTKQEKNNDSNESNGSNELPVIYLDKKVNYEIKDLFKMMKIIDEKFSFNDIKLIKYFIEYYVSNDLDSERYNSLKEMKKYIDSIGIYNIIVNDDEDLLKKMLNDLRLINEDVFMEFYSGKESFDIEDFCNFLDYEIGKCDPTIYIYVGNKKKNYDKIDSRIKTIYSKDIFKGLKIVYLNVLYDYSLS